LYVAGPIQKLTFSAGFAGLDPDGSGFADVYICVNGFGGEPYLTWNASRASPGIMLDGEAMAAPAPKNATLVASSEKAIDMTDRFASIRPLTTGELLSSFAFMTLTVEAKGKGSLSELGEFGGES
jgi:hypothetical protein